MRLVWGIAFLTLVSALTVAGLILAALSVIADHDLDGPQAVGDCDEG